MWMRGNSKAVMILFTKIKCTSSLSWGQHQKAQFTQYMKCNTIVYECIQTTTQSFTDKNTLSDLDARKINYIIN